MLFVTTICNCITFFYTTSATNQLTVKRALALYTWSKTFLTHVSVVKLFDHAFFCFPLTVNNSMTLIFLFDCLAIKLNIPTFLKDSICTLQVIYFNVYAQDKRKDVLREENFVASMHNVNNPKGLNTLKNNMRRITGICNVFVLILQLLHSRILALKPH